MRSRRRPRSRRIFAPRPSSFDAIHSSSDIARSSGSMRSLARDEACASAALGVDRSSPRVAPPVRSMVRIAAPGNSVQTTPVVTVLSVAAVRRARTPPATSSRSARRRSRRRRPGRLEWLGVAEGSRVKAGEVIARLDNRDVVAQAQSAARTCRPRAPRSSRRRPRSAMRPAHAQAQRGSARARVSCRSRPSTRRRRAPIARSPASRTRRRRSAWPRPNARNAQVAVDYTQIRAPFDGVILSKSANVGDMVTPFSSAADSKGAVVSMADMSTLEVEADVSECEPRQDQASASRARSRSTRCPMQRFRGRISRMVPTVDRARRRR
mgnify:CR=1 FL=1